MAGQGLTLGAITTTAGAVLPRLVPPELLAAANSLNSLVRYRRLHPRARLLGGLLLPVAGPRTLYLCDARLAVLLAVSVLPPCPGLPRPVAGFAPGRCP